MKNIFMYIRTQSFATHCENTCEKIAPLRTKGELQNAEVKGDQRGERDKFTTRVLNIPCSVTDKSKRTENHLRYSRLKNAYQPMTKLTLTEDTTQ